MNERFREKERERGGGGVRMREAIKIKDERLMEEGRENGQVSRPEF